MANLTSSVTITNGTNTATVGASQIAFKGITVTKEKVWSSDTGRSSTALMQGKIVAIKHTFQIKLIAIDSNTFNALEAVVTNKSNPFFTATVCDGVETYSGLTVYAGNTSVTVYNDKMQKYFDYTLELIER